MRPEDVDAATRDLIDPVGDAADQATRLRLLMEAEAALPGRRPAIDTDPEHPGEGRGDPVRSYGLVVPLDSPDALLDDEDAGDDASHDPLHHGGLEPADRLRSLPAEEAAMHVVDGDGIDRSFLVEDPRTGLTPEDETLLGIDPYEGGDSTR